MDEKAEQKIAVVGDVNGNITKLFSFAQNLRKNKNQFTCLFCMGNFFGKNMQLNQIELEKLRSGALKAPLPIYFMGPSSNDLKPFYEEFPSVPNITFLGKKGVIHLPCKLTVVYLSGNESAKGDQDNLDDDLCPQITPNDVKYIINALEPDKVYDILLTSQCPKNVTKFGNCDAKKEIIEADSSTLISHLAKAVKPRYHFASLHEEEFKPLYYRNYETSNKPCNNTYFYGLSNIDNKVKRKYFYLFSITPACFLSEKTLLSDTSGSVTHNPYDFDERITPKQVHDNQFFFQTETNHSSGRHSHGNKEERVMSQKRKKLDQEECWFCVGANPNFKRELCVAVGSHNYITVSRGPLVPKHVLIIPFFHVGSYHRCPDTTISEMKQYKQSLIDYFHVQNKGIIIFERNWRSPHMQLQVVPYPENPSLVNEITKVFVTEAKKFDKEFQSLSPHAKIPVEEEPYFHFEIIFEKKIVQRYFTILKAKVQRTSNFSAAFAKDALSRIESLGIEADAEWDLEKECMMASRMKKEFYPYDLTMFEISKKDYFDMEAAKHAASEEIERLKQKLQQYEQNDIE